MEEPFTPEQKEALRGMFREVIAKMDGADDEQLVGLFQSVLKEHLEPFDKRLTRLESLVFRALRMQ